MAENTASAAVPAFVGVDVGTGSARAGVFDQFGKLLGKGCQSIRTRTPFPDHFEQSSEDIWCACCAAVRSAISESGDVDVHGLSFDATCSLVVLGESGRPLAVGVDSPDNPALQCCDTDDVFNVIVWCDHRALSEASEINASGHPLLSYVGGAVSPEMELPKLAWLKKNRPETYGAAAYFFDLADFLTYRAASGKDKIVALRSMCTVVCKWNFDAVKRCWDHELLSAAGLADLSETRIGDPADVRDVGTRVPTGVSSAAAAELGIRPGTPLAIGIIDAHAGGIGTIGAGDGETMSHELPLSARLALIAGTSACHMVSSAMPTFVPGVWGPYDSAMVPGLFLNEGGQNAAGAALDFLVQTHAGYPLLLEVSKSKGCEPTQVLNDCIHRLALEKGLSHCAYLAEGLYVGADFSGNRSPLADAQLRGSVIGVGPIGPADKATSIDALAVLYLAALLGLSYSSRSIVHAIEEARISSSTAANECNSISAIFACGGLAQNSLYLQQHADVLGLPVYLPREADAVLLGSAMLAATSAGVYQTVGEAMACMGHIGSKILPCTDPQLRAFHEARYRIFKQMQLHQQQYRAMEKESLLTG